MNKVNSLTICRNEYKSKEEFEDAIKRAIMVLLDNNYIMTTRYDDKGLGIVSIDYNYSNQEYGCDYPYWLSPYEIDSVITDEERERIKNDEGC